MKDHQKSLKNHQKFIKKKRKKNSKTHPKPVFLFWNIFCGVNEQNMNLSDGITESYGRSPTENFAFPKIIGPELTPDSLESKRLCDLTSLIIDDIFRFYNIFQYYMKTIDFYHFQNNL